MDFIKIIERPVQVFDVGKLKVGDKVYYKEQESLWSTGDDGNGEVTYVSEDSLNIKYDGYRRNTVVTIEPFELEMGYKTIQLIK